MEESLPNYHEDHITGKGDNLLQHYNLACPGRWGPQGMPKTGSGGLARVPNLRVCERFRCCRGTRRVRERWINILPWYRLVGVAKNLQWDAKEEESGCPRRVSGRHVVLGRQSSPLLEVLDSRVWWRTQGSCGRPASDLGWGSASKTARGALLTGSPAGRTPLQGDGSMYSQSNVRAGKCAAAPYPSVAVCDRGHWKGDAGNGWAHARSRGQQCVKVFAPGCASKAGLVSRWRARRTQGQRSGDGCFSGWLMSSSSMRGTHMKDFEILDARIASALKRIINNTLFNRKVRLEEPKRPKKRTVSFAEDRSLTRSTSSPGSLGPTILSRTMPTYSLSVFEMMVFRNLIRSGTEF